MSNEKYKRKITFILFRSKQTLKIHHLLFDVNRLYRMCEINEIKRYKQNVRELHKIVQIDKILFCVFYFEEIIFLFKKLLIFLKEKA